MRIKKMLVILLSALLLTQSGCAMTTVDQMFQLPKRSEEYNNLQSAIDDAMTGLSYCAPTSGEHQQTVHMADVDGDGKNEYLLYAKGTQEKPLKILVFQEINGEFFNIDTIDANGTAFDMVEYVEMDDRPGVEMLVGHKISDQMLHTVTAYTFENGSFVQLATANYTKFLTTDLDSDHLSELFILRPGTSESDNGVAELYSMRNGAMERCNEVTMSQPVDRLKRIISGKLDGGKTAVYVASTVGDTALITDIYTLQDEKLTNVSLSSESGTSIHTMRNFYVFADDIDSDGVVELPSLISMVPLPNTPNGDTHHLIRWYAMTPTGAGVDKLYTYHNFVGGWYLRLDSAWAQRVTVQQQGNKTECYVWDEEFRKNDKILTIYAFTGQNREEQGLAEGRIILQKTDTVVYAALLSDKAAEYGIAPEDAVFCFRLIQKSWKTGET